MKSLIYWLVLAAVVLFFFTQMSDVKSELAKPEKNEDYYGMELTTDEDTIMGMKLYSLISEYQQNSYTTYPIGFMKSVRLNEGNREKMGRILKNLTGAASDEELGNLLNRASEGKVNDQGTVVGELLVPPKEGVSYDVFKDQMKAAAAIIGPGSSYSVGSLKSEYASQDYEGALDEYHTLVHDDKLSRGVARLFIDYMGIILSVLPMFLCVTRELRDKRAGMSALIFSRKASSFSIIISRFLSVCAMTILPVILLSCIPLYECISYGRVIHASVDYFAFIKYILGILLPEVMVVSALSMLLTQLTDTALAVLVQGVWAFASLFMGVHSIMGGNYGWNLIVRHNTTYNRSGFIADFSQLVWNRGLYALLALVLVFVTIWIFTQKRKGVLDIHGKLFGNRKRKSKA